MPKIAYKRGKPGAERREQIEQANAIIAEYQAAGYQLTLRQLYYQFVARDLIPNPVQSYKRFGDVLNEGRLLGLVDWDAIEDRTRNLAEQATWPGPHAIVQACAQQFCTDLWEDQPYRVEVWVEKEALAGVIDRVCETLRVPYLSCRGYTSQSEMWSAGMRLKRWVGQGYSVLILHLGDHDPSGIDMSRDISDRLQLFMEEAALELHFQRIALNMDQVEHYQPPPNPAKLTDSRCAGYMEKYGDESWELDALQPSVLAALITKAVTGVRNEPRWKAALEVEKRMREDLAQVADNWNEVTDFLNHGGED